jgi:hypothetical protein
MAQVIHTKKHGDHSFIKTWVETDGRHIGALEGGGFAYLSGLVVSRKQDLIDLIKEEEWLQKALDWWENKDQVTEEKEIKKVIFDNGTFCWEDGSPIISAQSLIENMPRGEELDMLLAWFHKREHKKAEEKKAEAEAQATQSQQSVKTNPKPGRPKKYR